MLPYISHIGICRPKGRGFWTFLVFAHFGLESGVVFEGTTGVYRFNGPFCRDGGHIELIRFIEYWDA